MLKSFLLCGMAVLMVSIGDFSFAGPPPGLAKQDKTPAGFTQGKKIGWQNEYPPGWDKKDAKGQKDSRKKAKRHGTKGVKVVKYHPLTVHLDVFGTSIVDTLGQRTVPN